MPFSKHSIAQAMQLPAEMVSMPRSSHSRLACATSSISDSAAVRAQHADGLVFRAFDFGLVFLDVAVFPARARAAKAALVGDDDLLAHHRAVEGLAALEGAGLKLRVGSAPTSSHHETTMVVP